jgi:hypothetical protein
MSAKFRSAVRWATLQEIMTTNNLVRVMAVALLSAAGACKSDFPAGSYGDGSAKDARDTLGKETSGFDASSGDGDDVGGVQVDGPLCRAPSPDYGPTSVFEKVPGGTPAPTVACPSACGDSAWFVFGSPNIDTALPYGACTAGTPSCHAGARVPCACSSEQGPVHSFNCSCEGSTWICRIDLMGTAICGGPSCASADAGVDQAVVIDGVHATPSDTGAMAVDAPETCRLPAPDYGPTTRFSDLPSDAPADTVACPAACGASAWPVISGYPNIDTALPYGSCVPGTPSCAVGARVPCPVCSPFSSSGPLHEFSCSCEAGTWNCRIRSRGMSICMPCADGSAGADLP